MKAAKADAGIRASREPKQRKTGRNPSKLGTERPRHVLLSHELKRPSTRDPLSPPPPEFDRDEVLVCMALAFCLADASTSIVYRLLG
jgi:hypothetical protein